MSTWSGIRHKLETEYLAPSLRGHIQYFATSYSKSPDHEGRAAIRYNGKEIVQFPSVFRYDIIYIKVRHKWFRRQTSLLIRKIEETV